MFTIDASVYLNSLNEHEAGSATSQLFLAHVHERALPIIVPTLLLVELASATARAFNDAAQGLKLAQSLQQLQGISWISLDPNLAWQASQLGAQYRLRGADAVYAAVAQQYRTTLVSLDEQHLQRLTTIVSVKKPSQIAL